MGQKAESPAFCLHVLHDMQASGIMFSCRMIAVQKALHLLLQGG